MLIRNAKVWGHGIADLRIAGGRIAELGTLLPIDGEPGIDAQGGALLPGLHDHHIHLAGLAARAASVWCGPPDIGNPDDLAQRLRAHPGQGWLRGIGYHESVMGLPGAAELDRLLPERPLRIQHRSGRMWLLNSPALAELLAKGEPPPGLERDAGGYTGRLFDEDQWLRSTLGSSPPDLTAISNELAAYGVTGVTDMSPGNDPVAAAYFGAQMVCGGLPQHCWLAGTLSLSQAPAGPWHLGPAKLHLHEATLGDFHETVNLIADAHRIGRQAAIHCVSEVELVYALAALEEAGVVRGDRIEHASVASQELVERIASLGLHVAVQPHFVLERGDQYLSDVEPRHHDELYRLRSFLQSGVTLAGGSDAPFVSCDPWVAMRAAVSRRTRSGAVIGAGEALSPEEALALYLADPADLPRTRRIAIGAPADLCLLERPWSEARERLVSADVRATFVGGRIVHNRIDKSPAHGMSD